MSFDAAQILRHAYASGASGAMAAGLSELDRAQAANVRRGELMGASFTVENDPMAELMDSMEELSFQFEEKEAKRVRDRKLGEMQGPRTALIRAVESWMAMMPDMPGREFVARMMRFLRSAFANGTPPNAAALLRELGRGSTDPSHQFALLDIMEQACAPGEDELLSLIRQAKAQLSEAKGAEIRVGINLAAEINARATTAEEMGGLRDMYRSEVVGFTTPQQCFRSLLAQRGAEGLKDAILFLIAGCGADLRASAPSLDAAILGRVLTDLQCVQVLQTVLEALGALGFRMGRQFGEPCRLTGEQMAARILEFTEQPFVASPAIAAFVGECGMARLLAQMDFTRELTGLFRKLSPRLFAKEGDRQRLVEAAQEHLDDLVAREEGGEQ